MFEIEAFMHEHPDWDTKLTQKPYCLQISYDGDYVLLKYNQIASDLSNPIVQQARGIIFNRYTLKPVCVPFFKFFNCQEPNAAEIDWSTAFVTEKVDGSLIKVWYDREWHISTNGTIDASKAELNNIKVATFRDYFDIALNNYYQAPEDFFNSLNAGYTYMFELVGPYHRIVIPYEKPALYFLGARDNASGKELVCTAENACALGVERFDRPTIFPLNSLDACVSLAETYSWDKEGFVVVDEHCNRVKIKSPAYVLAHFMRNNNVITRKHLINVILLNEVEEFICYASEYKDELLKYKSIMDSYLRIGNNLITSCKKMRILPKKKYAEIVKTFPGIFQGMLFYCYDHESTAEQYTANWSVYKWEIYIDKMEQFILDTFGSSYVNIL